MFTHEARVDDAILQPRRAPNLASVAPPFLIRPLADPSAYPLPIALLLLNPPGLFPVIYCRRRMNESG